MDISYEIKFQEYINLCCFEYFWRSSIFNALKDYRITWGCLIRKNKAYFGDYEP